MHVPPTLLLAATLALLTAPALAAPDWSCPAATRVWCAPGQPCAESEATPFVLLLIGSKGEIEYCEGEHCEYGLFAPAQPPRPDAERGLAFGWASVEPNPPPAGYVGRVYAVTLDPAAATVTLLRATEAGLEAIRASGCVPWP